MRVPEEFERSPQRKENPSPAVPLPFLTLNRKLAVNSFTVPAIGADRHVPQVLGKVSRTARSRVTALIVTGSA